MFAFALWDRRRRRLLVARDRIGKKPLFYAQRGGAFWFASEPRAILEDPEVPRDLDPAAIDGYLQYAFVHPPRSAFAALRKLPPAHVLTWEDGRVTTSRYWKLSYEPALAGASDAELHELIRERVLEATRLRIRSDVPVGALLSGGVDSSSVVAAMARVSGERVRTFSIGFDHPDWDETRHAREVARLYDTEHHELRLDASALDSLPRIVWHYGEPFADSSAIPSFYLAELTRRHVTVALNGDGGDESFAGYTRYVGNLMARRLERLPLPVRRLAAAMGDRLPTNANVSSTVNRARRLARSLPLDAPARYARHMAYFDWLQRDDLYTDEFRELIGESLAPEVIAGPWNSASGTETIDKMLETDVETYLPGDLLVKMDIATMAYSLEARSPLLDPEVMELAASLPAHMKLRGTEKKVILRDALRGWIPDEILDRPKMGFGVPIVDWFRHDLRDWARDILLDPTARERGWFDMGYVETTLERHASGIEDTSNRIWALLVLELWLQEFVDKPRASMPALAAT
jgi:asparagine synthase (glutamine-hydrolysing)